MKKMCVALINIHVSVENMAVSLEEHIFYQSRHSAHEFPFSLQQCPIMRKMNLQWEIHILLNSLIFVNIS